MSHCLAEVLTVHLLTLLTSILLLSLLLLRRPSVSALGLVAEKHEVEEFFRVDKVIVSELVKVTTMELMATPASSARCCPPLSAWRASATWVAPAGSTWLQARERLAAIIPTDSDSSCMCSDMRGVSDMRDVSV